MIGVITEEIGQDFPNRVTLLLGKSEAEPRFLVEEKAKQALIKLYNKVLSIPQDDLYFFRELAQEITDLNQPTHPEMSSILRDIFYTN